MHQFNSLWVLHISFKHQLQVSQWGSQIELQNCFPEILKFLNKEPLFPLLEEDVTAFIVN